MTGKEVMHVSHAHSSTIYSISISYNGKYLATGSADKLIKIWDMNTGDLIETLHGHTSHVTSVEWLPGSDQQLVSASWDETVKLWSWKEDDTPMHSLVGHTGKVNSAVVSPDGDSIISGGEDRLVKLWRISTHECFATMSGHTDEILCVAISPDGSTIASASKDKTIRTWTVYST